MSNLLIRNIDTHLKRRLEASARSHRRSLSEEARMLLKKALLETPEQRRMGDALLELVAPRYRRDGLVFEIGEEVSKPPDFAHDARGSHCDPRHRWLRGSWN
jgi:plasmid stability protein